MDIVLQFLNILNSLSPLAVIALLSLVLFYQARNKDKAENNFDSLTSNHLHELPDILVVLQRMEVANATAFAAILAKLNGSYDSRR